MDGQRPRRRRLSWGATAHAKTDSRALTFWYEDRIMLPLNAENRGRVVHEESEVVHVLVLPLPLDDNKQESLHPL